MQNYSRARQHSQIWSLVIHQLSCLLRDLSLIVTCQIQKDFCVWFNKFILIMCAKLVIPVKRNI